MSVPAVFLDPLTGLFGRDAFHAIGDQVLKIAAREKKEAALLLAVLPGGAGSGDPAREDLAGLLRASFRESDLLGRLGEDEFGVLAVAGAAMEEMLVTRLRENIEFHNQNNGRPYRLEAGLKWILRGPQSIRATADLLAEARA